MPITTAGSRRWLGAVATGVEIVCLLRRAYEGWAEAAAASGQELLVITGSVDASPDWDPLFQGALASAL